MISRKTVLVLFLVACAVAQDSLENTGIRVALKIYDDCSKADGFSPCLKKKAITFLDRLGRMDKFSLAEGVTVTKVADAPKEGPVVTEEQLEKTLPRSVDTKDEILTNMLMEKVTNFIGSRTVQVSLPKISGRELAEDLGIEEGRKKSGGGSFGGGGGGKMKMGGMMGGMMMGIAAKMVAMIPLAIGGLFLLAGKALITAKIALLLSGIIAIKKLFASKQGGGGGGGHSSGGWQSGGSIGGGYGGGGHGGGGWQSSGGGWDKRSLEEAQNLAYNAHIPQ